MKKWNRDWKIRLIEEKNPDWSDLYELFEYTYSVTRSYGRIETGKRSVVLLLANQGGI